MLERLAAWVLNTYLGEYLEDLNTDQLSIGLLKGAVELEGLPLKKDALRKLDLPLEVKSGFVGKISLNIPLTGFASQPWVINMDKLYVVAGPAAVETDIAAKNARQQERKARMLNELETLWQTERKLQASGSSASSSSASYWLSFGSSLVYNVIENLQLIVSNVHIRYEDQLSNAQQYAFGVTIHRLSAQSTDENWVPKFVSCSSNNLMRKLVDLNELAIYWATDVAHCVHLSQQDILEMLERGTETCHRTGEEKRQQYLLEPVSGRVRLQRNTSSLPLRSPHAPRLRLDARFDQFSLALEEDQYRGLLGLLKEIERHEKRKLNTYPRPAFRVRDGPRQWWAFAQQNVLQAIKEKNKRLTLAYLLKRCKDCCDYVRAYKAHLCAQKLCSTDQTLKADIEQEFTYNEIKLLREVAADHLKRDGYWFQGRVLSPTSASRSGDALSQQRVPSQPEQDLSSSSQTSTSTTSTPLQFGRLLSWAWSKVSSGSSDVVAPSAAPAAAPSPSPAAATATSAAATATSAAAEASSPPVAESEPDADERERITLTDAEREQLEQEIQDVLGEVRQESTSLLMRDAVFAELNFTLGSGSFALKFSDGDDEGVVKLVCDKIKAGLISQPRTRSMKFSLSLGGMYVRDLYNKKTLFPDLVAPRSCGRGSSDERRESASQAYLSSSSISDCADESAVLFKLLYELRPSDVTADHRLLMQTKPLDIVYNEAVIRRVKEFFIPKSRPHLGSVFGSELDLAAKALRRYEELKDRTKADIQTTLSKLLDGEQALMTARRWQVSLDISAPQIVVPSSCSSASGAVVVFDLGRIQLDNARQSMDSCRSPVATEASLSTSDGDREKQTLPHHVSIYFDSEENFVTPCSTPPSDYEAEKALTNGCEEGEATKGPSGYQDGRLQHEDMRLDMAMSVDPLALSMYHRLYERYALTLSDAQVLVGALHAEKGWLQASQRGSSPQHILDKFTVAFEFDRRLVLSSDPQYPAVKVGGSISSLRAHLTESKVRALSGCADLLLGPATTSKLPRQHSAVGAHHALNNSFLRTPGSERSSRVGNTLLEESKLTVLNFAIKELSVDVQSRGRCVAELQVSDAVFVCQRKSRELNVSFTVQTLLVVDALQTYGPDFELLVASHRNVVLDSRSGSLLASHVGSPVSPSSPLPPTSPPAAPLRSPGEPVLASADSHPGGTFVAFQNALLSRMHKLLAPTGSAGRESSSSGCKPDTSSTGRPQSGHAQECTSSACPNCSCAVSADARPLIEVNYRMSMPKPNQPGPCQHDVNVCFNSLELVANQGTIVELLRFFHSAFPRSVHATPMYKDNDGTTVASRVHIDPVRVTASFNRLNILLMCTMEKAKMIVAHKVATATLSHSRVNVTLGSRNIVEGHIGGLQMVDVSKNAKYQRIFSVGHDPVNPLPVSHSAPVSKEETHTEIRGAFYFYYNEGGLRPNIIDSASRDFITEEVHPSSSNGMQLLQPQGHLPDSGSCLRLKLGSMEYLHNPDFLRSLALCARQFRGYLDQLAVSLKTAASDIAMSIVKKHAHQLPTLNLSSPDLEGVSKAFISDVASPKHQQCRESLGDTDSRDSLLGSTLPFAGLTSSVGRDPIAVPHGYLRLDVDLDTPIIMLPRSSECDELLVAHLGRMTVSNSRSVSTHGLISGHVVDRVLVDVADIKLFTTTSSATSEACQHFIIDDAAIELAVEYHHLEGRRSEEANSTEFVLNSEDYDNSSRDGSLLEIKGTVRRSMQIRLSRNVCEQIKDTVVTLTKVAEPPVADEPGKNYVLPQESAAMAGLGSMDVDRSVESSLSALKLDDDGNDGMAAATSALEQDAPTSETVTPPMGVAAATVFLPMKAVFTMENLCISLRGDLGDERETNIVDITFNDFLLSGEKSDPHVTAVEIRLHGLHVRDCLQPSSSARNLLITSNPRDSVTTKNLERPSYLSTSCPDPTISWQLNTLTLPSSFPEVSHVKSAVLGLRGSQHRTAAQRRRPGSIYPATPPSSPANERTESKASNISDSGLAHISLVFVDPSCPDFNAEYDQATCLASIVFNSLEVDVNLETWVVLLDFFGIGAKVFPETLEVLPGPSPSRSDADKIKVTLEVSSLALTLNKPAYPLARASVEGLSTVVVKSDDDIHLKGTLDRISVADLSPHGRLYPQKLATFGHSALTFDVHKYSKPDPNLKRSFDVSVMMDLSSVCYTHTKRFCCELLNYFQDFNDHYDALGHMRAAAAGQKVPVFGGRSPRILLRICAATPIILLPQSSSSTQVLIVYLGNLLLENRFLFAGQEGTLSRGPSATSTSDCHSDTVSAGRGDLSGTHCNDVPDLATQSARGTVLGTRDCMTQSLFGSLEDDVRREELVESVSLLAGQKASAPGPSPSDDNYCCLLDVMSITLSDMDLHSGVRIDTASTAGSAANESGTASRDALVLLDYAIMKEANHPLKEKCMLKLVVERNLDNDMSHNSPELAVHGVLSSVNCAIDSSQYKLVFGILDKNLGEDMPDLIRLRKQDPKIQTVLSGKVYRTLFFDVEMHNVSLELHGSGDNCYRTSSASNNARSIAKLDFIKSRLTFEGFSNQSKNIDLVSREIRICDTRYLESTANMRPNRFVDILQPTAGDKQANADMLQAELHYHSSAHGPPRLTALLNNMRVMAVISWWVALKDFFITEASGTVDRTGQTSNGTQSAASSSEGRGKPNLPLQVKLNLTNTEVVLVEDPSTLDTSGVILRATVALQYSPVSTVVASAIGIQSVANDRLLSCSVHDLELFSCCLAAEESTAMSIIDPVSMSLEMCKSQTGMLGLSTAVDLPRLEISLTSFVVRLSYTDLLLFRSVAKSFAAFNTDRMADTDRLTRNSEGFEVEPHAVNSPKVAPSAATHYSILLEAALVASVELKVDAVCLCFIDDCGTVDIPLVELRLKDCVFIQHMYSQFGGDGSFVLDADCYNRLLCGWEPLVETWRGHFSWSLNLLGDNDVIFKMKSDDVLSINITNNFLNLLKTTKAAWVDDYSRRLVANQKHHTDRSKAMFTPYRLKNLTGCTVWLLPYMTDDGGTSQRRCLARGSESSVTWNRVEHDEEISLIFVDKDKLRHQITHEPKSRHLCVRIDGYLEVTPVCVDTVGAFYRMAKPAEQNAWLPPARVVFQVHLEKNAFKVITIRSSLTVVNSLSESVEVKLESLVQNGVAKSLQLDAGKWLPVPLRLAFCRMWVRPAFWDLPFCSQPIEWHRDPGDESAWTTAQGSSCNGPRVCQSQPPRQGVYRFCVSTRSDGYPEGCSASMRALLTDGRACAQPAHTVVLLPPLTLVNLLPLEIAYYVRGSEACGKIASGSSASLFTVNVAAAVELGITLENFPTCRELVIPSGATEYKCKMQLCDAKDRALYVQAYVRSKKGGGALKVSFSVPYWLVNRSGLPLVFRQDSTRVETAGQFEEHEMARSVAPLPFCFPDRDAPALCTMRLGRSVHGPGAAPQWCHSYVLENGVTVRPLYVTPNDNRPDWVYNIGIEVHQGTAKYADTRFVTFSPRFQLSNQSSYKLAYCQKYSLAQDRCSEETYLTALPKSSLAFHWPRVDFDQLLCIRIVDDQNQWQWSGGFRIDAINSFYINIRAKQGPSVFLHVEVALHGATYVVVFADASHLPPPMRIDNRTEVSVRFWQANSGDERLKTIVRPGTCVAYAWDEPTLEHCLLCTVLGTGAATVGTYNMDVIGEGEQLQYENFIYLALSHSFDRTQPSFDTASTCQELVLDVINGNQVILNRKEVGKRSQLWRMTSSGMIEHEGSSVPRDLRSKGSSTAIAVAGYVLDIADIAVLPNSAAQALMLQKPNPRRQTTQRWMFTPDGRMVCGADGRCVQAAELRAGARLFLGSISASSTERASVEPQRMLPGSGVVSVSVVADGPSRVLRLCDFHRRVASASARLSSTSSAPDSVQSRNKATTVTKHSVRKNFKFMCIMPAGVGISIVNAVPEELVYVSLSDIYLELSDSSAGVQLEAKIGKLQADNQLLSSTKPVLLAVAPTAKKSQEDTTPALFLSFQKLPSQDYNCTVFKYLKAFLKPVILSMEEVLLWKLAAFFGLAQLHVTTPSKINDLEHELQRRAMFMPQARRYYFELLSIVANQICLSMTTTSGLSPDLKALKRRTGIPLISFEDAKIELDPFVQKYLFETQEFLANVVLCHFKGEIQRQAGKILGSVNFLGNPLGLFNDVANGLNSLIVDGSVGGLVKNVAHGASDSLAKVAGTLAQGIGRLALDDDHERSRVALRQRQREDGVVAGFLGLGHGIFGGLTSFVSQTYDGAMRGGVEGLFSGMAKGMVGTVAKPVAGILDFASGAASAVRDTSRSQQRPAGERAREPRCCCGDGGCGTTWLTTRLLRPYRRDRALIQRDLFHMVSAAGRGSQGPGPIERLLDYLELQQRSDSDGLSLSCLITDCGVYIINGAMTVNSVSFSVKYSELISCSYIERPTSAIGSVVSKPRCYLELRIRCDGVGAGSISIATTGSGVDDAVRSRAPQFRCDSAAVCNVAVTTILLAKAQHDDRMYAVTINTELPEGDPLPLSCSR